MKTQYRSGIISSQIGNKLFYLKDRKTEGFKYMSSINYYIMSKEIVSNHFFTNGSDLHIRWPKYWSLVLASVLPVNIQGYYLYVI